MPDRGNKPQRYRPERFQLFVTNYSKRNTEMQSINFKNIYIYQLVIFNFAFGLAVTESGIATK